MASSTLLVQLPPDDVEVVEEIRKLFHATDEDGNGRLSSDEIKNLMELSAGLDGQGNRTIKHSQEVFAFVELLDMDGNNQIEEQELIKFMVDWQRENNFRKNIGISSERVPTRHWIHTNISWFFTQVDTFDYTQACRRLFQNPEDFEQGLLDASLRGHPHYDQAKKQARLKEAIQLMEAHNDPDKLSKLQLSLYDADVRVVARAVEDIAKMLQLVEAFPSMEERFYLRHPLLAIFDACFKAPVAPLYDTYGNSVTAIYLRLNDLLGHPRAPLNVRAKACEGLFYFLVGPGVPPGYLNHYTRNGVPLNMFGSVYNHLHPSKSLAIKQPLVRSQIVTNVYDLIIMGVREVGMSVTDQILGLQCIEWATKVLAVFAEWDELARSTAIQAGFIELLLISVMDETLLPLSRLVIPTTGQNIKEQLSRSLRASTYALAVLLGHTHNDHECLVNWTTGTGSAIPLMDCVVRYVNATNDASVNANCLLCLEKLVAIRNDAASLDQFLQLLMGVATKQYSSEDSAARVLLVVFSIIEDFAERKKEVLPVLLKHDLFNRIMPEILILPMAHKKLILMAVRLLGVMAGPDVARLMGADHLPCLHKYIVPVVALFHRDEMDVVRESLNFFKALLASEPLCTDDYLRLGLINSLTSLFSLFKQADNVLANIYGLLVDSYQSDVVMDSLIILKQMVKTTQRESFLRYFSIEDTQRFRRLHRSLVVEGQRPGAAEFLEEHLHQGSVTLTEIGQAAKTFLIDVCQLAQAERTPHALTITDTCEPLLEIWQDSLYTPVAYADAQEPEENMDLGLRDRMPCQVKGPAVVLYATPRGWAAEPYQFVTCITASLAELKAWLFDHFRVRCNLVVEDPAKRDLSTDEVVTQYLTALAGDNGKTGMIFLEPISSFMTTATTVMVADGGLQVAGAAPTTTELISFLNSNQLQLELHHIEAIHNFFLRSQIEGWVLTFRDFRDLFIPAMGMKIQNSWVKIIFDLFDEDKSGKLSIYELTRAMAVMTDNQHKHRRAEALFDKYAPNTSPFLTEETLGLAMMKVDPDPRPETEYHNIARQMLVKYSGGAGLDRKAFVEHAEDITPMFMKRDFYLNYNYHWFNNNGYFQDEGYPQGWQTEWNYRGRGRKYWSARGRLGPHENWQGRGYQNRRFNYNNDYYDDEYGYNNSVPLAMRGGGRGWRGRGRRYYRGS